MKRFLTKLAGHLLIALSLGLFVSPLVSLAAFGISPPWVKNNNMLPGSVYEQVVYLSRNETDQAMKAGIRTTGDEELLEWLSIPGQENLIFDEGQRVLPMTVIVSVPEEAELKKYSGGIHVTLSPLSDENIMESGEVGIGLGARVALEITVTGKHIEDYQIKSVSVEPQQAGEPFAITVKVENRGNVAISEIEGDIDVYNSGHTDIVKSLGFLPPETPVAFNETKDVKMIYEDFRPKAGEYWVDVKTYRGEKVTYEDRYLYKVEGEVEVSTGTEEVPADLIVSDTPLTDVEMLSAIATPEETNYTFLIVGLVVLAAAALLYIMRL